MAFARRYRGGGFIDYGTYVEGLELKPLWSGLHVIPKYGESLLRTPLRCSHPALQNH